MLSKNQNNYQITARDGFGREMLEAAFSVLRVFLSTLMLVLLVLAFIFVALLLTSGIADHLWHGRARKLHDIWRG